MSVAAGGEVDEGDLRQEGRVEAQIGQRAPEIPSEAEAAPVVTLYLQIRP